MSRVHVIGNITEDLFFRVPRLPRDGETLIATSRLSDIGGKGMNQAVLMARAGLDVSFIAPVGSDLAGERARDLLTHEPLDARLLSVVAPTDQSIIYVAEGGENIIVSSAAAADSLTPAHAKAAAKDWASGDLLVLQGNLSYVTTSELLKLAQDRGVRTLVNPSPIRWSWNGLWGAIDTAILNREELAQVSGLQDVASGLEFLSAHGATPLVTLGRQGARLNSCGQQYEASAAPAQVVDTAGAGDTFCAAYVASVERGASQQIALDRAARAAAITIGRPGTYSAFPSRSEFAALFAEDVVE